MQIDDRGRDAHKMSQRLHFVGRGWSVESIQWVLDAIGERFEARRKWEVMSQFVKVEISDNLEREEKRARARAIIDSLALEDIEEVIKKFSDVESALE